jgi:undecaprenyl-diphosphatase
MSSFNQSLFQIIYSLSHKHWFFDYVSIFFAEYLPYILLIFFALTVFSEKDFRKRVYFFSLVALSVILSFGIVAEAMRYFFASPRPFLELGFIPLINDPGTNSMPSGHMMVLMPFGLTLYQLNKRKGISFMILVAIVGFFRIVTGVHWPLDILAGLILSVPCFYLVKRLLPAYKNKN